MKDRINNILLELLWLLAATLGISFWFNTKFGFNIFSGAHWQYLGYLQASRMPVTPVFYISWIVAIFITTVGLYILVRPNVRRIRLHAPAAKPATKQVASPAPAKTAPEKPAPAMQPAAPDTPHAATTPVAQHAAPATPRPPRPTIPALNTLITNPTAPQSVAPAPVPVAPSQDVPEIREIFTDAKYIVKKAGRISKFKPALLAIGANETLWIGAVGVPTDDLKQAIDKLAGVFSDTLDDIEIHINGFIVGATGTPTPDANILHFGSISELREYINSHPNPPIDTAEQENFDAYSEYIDTVLQYMEKL